MRLLQTKLQNTNASLLFLPTLRHTKTHHIHSSVSPTAPDLPLKVLGAGTWFCVVTFHSPRAGIDFSSLPRLEWMTWPWLTCTWPCRPPQGTTAGRTTTATNWQPVHRVCRRLWKVRHGFFLPAVTCTLPNSKEFLKEWTLSRWAFQKYPYQPHNCLYSYLCDA